MLRSIRYTIHKFYTVKKCVDSRVQSVADFRGHTLYAYKILDTIYMRIKLRFRYSFYPYRVCAF